tara:strand:+ start:52 stop:567 length:516 start_codon:yes stop_codon:yes gene_type:complete
MKNNLTEDIKRIHTLTYGSDKKIKIVESIESETKKQRIYEQDCEFEFDFFHSDLKYKGKDIDKLTCGGHTLKFMIDISYSGDGIGSVYPYGIKGYEAIEVEVSFFPEGLEGDVDVEEEFFDLELDWSKANFETESPQSFIGISNKVEIELVNDSEGNIIAKQINGVAYGVL